MNANIPTLPVYCKDITNMVPRNDHVEYTFTNEVSAIALTKDLIGDVECKYTRHGNIVKVYYFGEYTPNQIVDILKQAYNLPTAA